MATATKAQWQIDMEARDAAATKAWLVLNKSGHHLGHTVWAVTEAEALETAKRECREAGWSEDVTVCRSF